MIRIPLALSAALCAVLVFVLACVPTPPPAPPAPVLGDCSTACARWRELGCAEGDDTPDGQSCEAVCAMWATYWNMGCLSDVDTCDDLDRC